MVLKDRVVLKVTGPQGEPGADFDLYGDLDLDGVADWLEVMLGTDPTDEMDTPPTIESSPNVPEA